MQKHRWQYNTGAGNVYSEHVRRANRPGKVSIPVGLWKEKKEITRRTRLDCSSPARAYRPRTYVNRVHDFGAAKTFGAVRTNAPDVPTRVLNARPACLCFTEGGEDMDSLLGESRTKGLAPRSELCFFFFFCTQSHNDLY